MQYLEFKKRMTPGQSVVFVKDEKTGDLTVRLQSAEATAKNAADAEAMRKAHPINVPAIDLSDLAGRQYHDADLRGRPTLLTSSSSTCVPCIRKCRC